MAKTSVHLLPPVSLPVRPCLGCGRVKVRGWHYCHSCLWRLRHGYAVGDVDDLPTMAELARIGVFPSRCGR